MNRVILSLDFEGSTNLNSFYGNERTCIYYLSDITNRMGKGNVLDGTGELNFDYILKFHKERGSFVFASRIKEIV